MGFSFSLGSWKKYNGTLWDGARLIGEQVLKYFLTNFLLGDFHVVGLFAGIFDRLLEAFDPLEQFVYPPGRQRARELDGPPVADRDIFVVDFHLSRVMLGGFGLDVVPRD